MRGSDSSSSPRSRRGEPAHGKIWMPGVTGSPRRAASTVAPPYALLSVIVALSIGLGFLHNRLENRHRPNPVLSGVRLFVYPFQKGAFHLSGGVSTGWSWLFKGKALSEENARLRRENARLNTENEILRADSAEAQRLRSALGFAGKTKKPPLPAEVIGLLPSPLLDTIVIARGTRDGIREGKVARTPDGLMGQVTSVSPLSSQVMLLSDVSSGVSALVLRKNKTQGVGIVQGAGRGQRLDLVYLKREADIQKGDLVVSSGYGGVIPPEIPIGVIVSVDEDKARFLKSAKVVPYAPMPGRVREVFLVP